MKVERQEGRPVKVAIVGGGCASMAAAFELTRPVHRGRYQVTVYQLGWRLGGKGASGRGPAGRIEEHGLHVWMGWYENAFRLVRECYEELGRDPVRCPIAGWRDAFVPAPLVGVADRDRGGSWTVWEQLLPPTEGLPGDPLPSGQRWTMRDYMIRTAVLLRSLLANVFRADPGGADSAATENPSAGTGGWSTQTVLDRIARFLRYGELATLTGLVQAVTVLEVMLGGLSQYPQNVALRFLDAIAGNARALIEARLDENPELRRVWQVLDLTFATLRGEIRFGVFNDPRGFDAVDEYDCREWLLLNGAAESSVSCGFLRALYDLGFSYEDGDPARPRVAAGHALRGIVRAFFTYRGAFFWRMQAGMGDVVFAPFYEVLKRRGVRFEFFHRLEHVRLVDPGRLAAGDAPYVEALAFDVQADVIGGREYQPLVDVGGLPCWPSTPDYRQLVDGVRVEHERWEFESHWDRRRARTRTLRVTDDFDVVVLGIGIGAIPFVAGDLLARDPRWRAMVDHVKTVATQAFQIWLACDLKELGWMSPPLTLAGFITPFDTWADMRHLLPREGWPTPPRGLVYFCSVLADSAASDDRSNGSFPAAQREEVRRNAIRFLNDEIVHLWPNAGEAPRRFRWDLLVDPTGSRGEDRFASQHWSANVSPSDRYTLTLPGSTAYRISPLDGTYDNLTIAGDWTECGVHAGCVEAAVMSGRLAAHAVSLSPPLEDIVGYDHP